ncbi:hypothetical protein N7493_003005 [Penicillium malachiteum]|uniref:Transposable element tc3 transposase n=2 Tax=Penicillium malachiteum TaxID=1324776 RepID=A0AAD6HTX8_9EURO|nr:hypothetical protein N7493_012043 [Penicillium malachiteum]KAJ5710100.1 hypothetical protein N7493_009692 [Penicillium malachiteum]KAJ5710101.1 hypothetical protein N7493_009693 [Penicillium malachiteum]KAJ5710126.1 hypothetical protein N7493_009718 [Penicillium malachiteum]KAJ5712431.1 hypothetical protein N7493_008899 [Penicillium malachiteum]
MPILTRDQRQIIRVQRNDGKTYGQIARSTGATKAQIQYTLRDNVDLTPQKKKTGRPPKLSTADIDEIITFIRSSIERRILTCEQICCLLQLPVSAETLRTSLKQRGMTAHPAAQKPPIQAHHAQIRIAWAQERENWQFDDWARVIFSDEAWFKSGWHRMPFIHRFKDERYHPTAVVGQSKQRSGIMVWACFAGRFKGPLVIWDPAWGSITSASYIEHIIPVIEEFNEFLWSKGIDAYLMQDGAGPHHAYTTTAEFYDRDINIEDAWHPSVSPDLNPQENIWNWLKEDVSKQCGINNIPKARHHILIQYIQQAWDRLPEEYLVSLTASMPTRVQQVLERQGAATDY